MLTKENSNVQNPPERTGRLAKSAKRVMVAKALATKKPPKEAFECIGNDLLLSLMTWRKPTANCNRLYRQF